jgi:hypothetical protein
LLVVVVIVVVVVVEAAAVKIKAGRGIFLRTLDRATGRGR